MLKLLQFLHCGKQYILAVRNFLQGQKFSYMRGFNISSVFNEIHGNSQPYKSQYHWFVLFAIWKQNLFVENVPHWSVFSSAVALPEMYHRTFRKRCSHFGNRLQIRLEKLMYIKLVLLAASSTVAISFLISCLKWWSKTLTLLSMKRCRWWGHLQYPSKSVAHSDNSSKHYCVSRLQNCDMN